MVAVSKIRRPERWGGHLLQDGQVGVVVVAAAAGVPTEEGQTPAESRPPKTLMARFRLKRDPKSDSMMRKAIGSLMRVASSNVKPVFSGEDLREVVVVTHARVSRENRDRHHHAALEQTKELCRQLNAFATNLCTDVDGVQIILAGDLNATPNEACVVHLRGRGMRSERRADMSIALGHPRTRARTDSRRGRLARASSRRVK